MRPLPGDDALLARQRCSDTDSTAPSATNLLHRQPSGSQMTYFLADEDAMDASSHQSNIALLRQRERERDSRKHTTPEHPLVSLPTALGGVTSEQGADSLPAVHQPGTAHSSRPPSRQPSNPGAPNSQPMTPIFGVSEHGSAISGASSPRQSLSGSFLEDQHSSHGSCTAKEMEPRPQHQRQHQELAMMDSGSAPQLVMPSIKMPSRRPFTETGRAIGKLKILVAGDSGVGKTSLIKAIVQTCGEIVHVDPISPSTFGPAGLQGKGGGSAKAPAQSPVSTTPSRTRHLTEIYASTKPYPTWWADIEDTSVLLRRKSLGDSILERNICFVDTPGYGTTATPMDTIVPVVDYVESQLRKMSLNCLGDAEVLSMVGGDGGCQVDVAFYVFAGGITSADVEYLQLLSPLTNVIPILAQVDKLSREDLEIRKACILTRLREAGFQPFLFDEPGDVSNTSLYTVSSAAGSDYDTMDASLLMAPDYVEPLVLTQLSALVELVFSSDGASRLRHVAARKYLSWQHQTRGHQTHGPTTSSTLPEPSPSASQLTHTSLLGTPPSYVTARVLDHTQREERMARVRLANWATELQKNLEDERACYEALAGDQRAVWLTQRLSECVQDGTLVPRSSVSKDSSQSNPAKGTSRRRAPKLQPGQDPLGLLDVVAKLKRRGWLMLELAASAGVLGGLAFWASTHYWHIQVYSWVGEQWFKLSSARWW